MMYRKYESSARTPAPVASPDQLARSSARRNATLREAITEFMYKKPMVASTATTSVTATITGCLLLGIRSTPRRERRARGAFEGGVKEEASHILKYPILKYIVLVHSVFAHS